MTRIVEPDQPSLPRPYTAAELEAIAKSIGRDGLRPLAIGKLQEAVIAYQWAKAADEDIWHQHGGKHRSAKNAGARSFKTSFDFVKRKRLKKLPLL
jgi:hypothetical protein